MDGLSLETSQLSDLHDTASKVAFPTPKRSSLPARKKKSTSESNTGEGSEVDEDAKKTRKDRMARSISKTSHTHPPA